MKASSRFRSIHRYPFIHLVLVLIIVVCATHPTFAADARYKRQWYLIDSLIDMRLTATATDSVNVLLKSVKAAGDGEQTVKALIYLMRLGSFKEEDALVKSIDLLKQSISGTPPPVRSILYSMLGECYLHYYRNNLWRFLDRTQTTAPTPEDMRTWDLRTIMEHTTDAYLQSLGNAAALKSVSLTEFGETIIEHRNDVSRCPTLYDLLLHRAIDFFSIDDNELTRPALEFTIDRSDYFKPYEAFVRLKITTRDTSSLKYRALRLLGECIAFHAKDADPTALIAADLKRLDFVKERSVLENRDSLYLAALRYLQKKLSRYPASAEVTARIAEHLYAQSQSTLRNPDDPARWLGRDAIALCDKAIRTFPDTYGADRCKALADRIREKRLDLTVANTVLPDKPFNILLTCRNLTKVYWRQVPFDAARWRTLVSNVRNDSVASALAAVVPTREWSTALPDRGDYRSYSLEIAQEKLPLGHYIILCSTSPKFSCSDNAVVWGAVQVTRLGYITRTLPSGEQEFRLLDRRTGTPLPGVKVTGYTQEYSRKTRTYHDVTAGAWISDARGRVLIPPKKGKQRNISIVCTSGNDRFDSDRRFYLYRYGTPSKKMQHRTFFFTDRAIYRPGQTIYFKGIMLSTDGEKSEIAAGRKTTVRLYDVNGQEVAHLDLSSNAYGSVHGSFTAPTGVLNGQMHISNGEGTQYVAVEEYKRPKFSVTVNAYKGVSRLGDSIRISGRATAYSGQAIGDAQVQFRIVREARFPQYWWYRWQPPRRESTMEIGNGSVATDDTGGFCIDFIALADRSIPRSDDPVFTYTVTVDVTDITGETQSATGSVRVSYSSMHLDLNIPREAATGNPLELSLSSANTNGTFVPATGEISIHRLKPPATVYRSRLWERPDTALMTETDYRERFPGDLYGNENDITTWKRGKQVFKTGFSTPKDSTITPSKSAGWPPGVYVAEGRTTDRDGRKIVTRRYFTLYSEKGEKLPFPQADFFVPVRDAGEPGSTARFLVGSGYENVTVLYEIEHKRKIVRTASLEIDNGQKLIELPIEEQHRGGFSLHVAFMHDNRVYLHSATVSVPWTNKELALSFETFRDKLTPGEKEQWRLKVTGKNGDKVAAEMVAALYDASLDAFTPHGWTFSIYPMYSAGQSWGSDNGFSVGHSQRCEHDWNTRFVPRTRYYPMLKWFGYGFQGGRGGYGGVNYDGIERMSYELKSSPAPSKAPVRRAKVMKMEGNTSDNESPSQAPAAPPPAPPAATGKTEPDLTKVVARTNLNETAFFFPTLTTNDSGDVVINFRIPEALTKWNMLGFAHTKDLRYGQLTGSLITRKDLMIVPHPPRFFRENDRITFTAKVSNLSGKKLNGTAQLFLFDAATMQPVDSAFANRTAQRKFNVEKGKSAPLSWDLSVPEGIGAVTFRVVAKAGTFSDGEEQMLPVLTNRMLVTETLPLSIRKKGTKKFTLQNLVSNNGGSTTLRNHRLTLEFTTNPVWYAVQALPYLIEYPYECAEQLFSRLYANSLASHIVNSSPRIKAVFAQWKTRSPDALLSNLEKNSELKALALEETPWLLDGKNESERKQRIALLFDLNTMADGTERALRRLRKMQLPEGAWPWFEGSSADRYITQYIVTGLGRLEHLGVIHGEKDERLAAMLRSALRYLDEEIRDDYRYIMQHFDPENDHLSEIHIQYLYMRSFFGNTDIATGCKKAFDYFDGQARRYWTKKRRYMQGMIALAQHRGGATKLPETIIRSLKENALVNEETGMYWKEMYEGHSWWWYEAPIEMQSLMIEAFEEVAHDTIAVEECKTWLLKSKQTQNWRTTRATAEACYALLLRGTDQLEKQPEVTIRLGKFSVNPQKQKELSTEAGTGYFKTAWTADRITPDMGSVSVTTDRNTVSWGAVYWQYFEQLDKIQHASTPLRIDKKLYLRKNGDTGPRLTPVTGKAVLKPGDQLTVRIELRVDRDMEYVHMKDMRASGFEPRNVFSGYRWQDGLGYYESTRDAATNFFFPALGKGTYVFEYPLSVAHAGDFSNGITTIQCMYAPEFTSQSEGVRVKVQKR
ncbi:MAG: hypothetical protein JW863_07400 [Chitinispirillaceae bacterium]|nr:hypothetical protein [Chitinispirillaceae bacterium]